MKNVDVPIWDKGDSTDNYAKGGSSISTIARRSPIKKKNDKEEKIKKIFELVLGREPSTRELAYYKYSAYETKEIAQELLESEEHSDTIEKGIKYQQLEIDLHKSKSRILKLQSVLDDKEKELEENMKLLNEKNKLIENLRDKTDVPYITNTLLLKKEESLELKNEPYYTNLTEHKSKKVTDIWDKILSILFGGNQ